MPNIYLANEVYNRIVKLGQDVTKFVDQAVREKLEDIEEDE